ncbi:MAG: flavohemoglobin expression-modulating QEGLA motif protein [Fibrobacterota bacterium]
MRRLSLRTITDNIARGRCFSAATGDGALEIKIDKYVPFIGTAVHTGSNLRESLQKKTALSEYDRWHEEDPYTGDFIDVLPITIKAMDSRYEYDLNRPPDSAIYDEAWGTQVWKKPLTLREREISLKKHEQYYTVLKALLHRLEDEFKRVLVFDIHSYNYRRWDRPVPLFNIGTEQVDTAVFQPVIDTWVTRLSRCSIANESGVKCNDVFFGRGYNLRFVKTHFPRSLVLATEIKKVYCDERTGESYPQVIQELKIALRRACIDTAYFFADTMTDWELQKKHRLLPEKPTDTLVQIDKKLYSMMRRFELLPLLNPLNMTRERKSFFSEKYQKNPVFRYRKIKIDAFLLKRELLNIPLENLNDVSLQKLYADAIKGFSDQIDMIASRDSDAFFYNSLRYFGEPSERDLRNARYLLMLPPIEEEERQGPTFGAREARDVFMKGFAEYGFSGKCEIQKNIVSSVMVVNRDKKVVIKEDARFSRQELQYLVHHEIGVHMLTTINADSHTLKLFSIGHPVNTKTQEGLAVLAEYLSGHLTMRRMKKLALRVIAVADMCSGMDFKTVFSRLVEEYHISPSEAFTITARVFRGGGLTKDYLYLSGFSQIHRFWKNDMDLTPLLLGKCSAEYYGITAELRDRKMLADPAHTPQWLTHSREGDNNPIFNYILNGLG